ncbi:MAG: hypothetical protein PHT33_06900 [bacterium]|nr:hypothetical protein [bacterium]
MKIVATVSDVTEVVHCGGRAEIVSAVIEIPDESLPAIVRQHLAHKKQCNEHGCGCFSTVSFSYMEEEVES